MKTNLEIKRNQSFIMLSSSDDERMNPVGMKSSFADVATKQIIQFDRMLYSISST